MAKFLDYKLSYLDIAEAIEYSMAECSYKDNPSIEEILESEKEAIELVETFASKK